MAHDKKYIIPFALLLVMVVSLPQPALGLKCYNCDTETCDDTQIQDCSPTDTVCMGMKFESPLMPGGQKPIIRGCFSPSIASCVGNTDNKCYAVGDVRQACKPFIETMLKQGGTPDALVDLIVANLDGKICACLTDNCNKELKEQSPSPVDPTTSGPSKSSGTVFYENLKHHRWIVTLLSVILYSQA